MKKLKLTLNKETIASLSSKELGNIKGGSDNVFCDTQGCDTRLDNNGPCATNYTNVDCGSQDYSCGGGGCDGTYMCTNMTSQTCGFCA